MCLRPDEIFKSSRARPSPPAIVSRCALNTCVYIYINARVKSLMGHWQSTCLYVYVCTSVGREGRDKQAPRASIIKNCLLCAREEGRERECVKGCTVVYTCYAAVSFHRVAGDGQRHKGGGQWNEGMSKQTVATRVKSHLFRLIKRSVARGPTLVPKGFSLSLLCSN